MIISLPSPPITSKQKRERDLFPTPLLNFKNIRTWEVVTIPLPSSSPPPKTPPTPRARGGTPLYPLLASPSKLPNFQTHHKKDTSLISNTHQKDKLPKNQKSGRLSSPSKHTIRKILSLILNTHERISHLKIRRVAES